MQEHVNITLRTKSKVARNALSYMRARWDGHIPTAGDVPVRYLKMPTMPWNASFISEEIIMGLVPANSLSVADFGFATPCDREEPVMGTVPSHL